MKMHRPYQPRGSGPYGPTYALVSVLRNPASSFYGYYCGDDPSLSTSAQTLSIAPPHPEAFVCPMNAATPLPGNSELAAALLQAAITTALAALCAFLFQRYRKPYLAWWSVAWTLYLLRLPATIIFGSHPPSGRSS